MNSPSAISSQSASSSYISFPARRKPKTLPADLTQFGIGGLQDMKEQLIHDIILPRIDPSYKQYGTPAQSGVLLYGPPGTGKTLTARSLGSIFDYLRVSVTIRTVNGPELLTKWVGETERKLRELFTPLPNEEAILIIIFDEIDAIGATRGSSNSGSGNARDSVLTQLLTMMDGVDSEGNRKSDRILVIGMTNRRDILDPALTRPGRFDISCHIGLPDEVGRRQILNIHTESLRKNGLLGDVDLDMLAKCTENYSGSDLKDLVQRATQYANERNYNVKGATFELKEEAKLHPEIVSEKDFQRSLRTSFTQAKLLEALEPYRRSKYIPFNETLENFIEDFLASYTQAEKETGYLPSCWFIDGNSRTGKTALAVHVAIASRCPALFMLTPMDVIASDAGERIRKLEHLSEQAQESDHAIIILDGLDEILGNLGEGEHCQDSVLEQITAMFTSKRKRNNKICYLATARNNFFYSMTGVDKLFQQTMFTMPKVRQRQELETIYKEKNADRTSLEKLAELLPSNIGRLIEEIEFESFLSMVSE